ncbi:MAG: HRDC domain-containing protein [Phycisphaerales bacterium]
MARTGQRYGAGYLADVLRGADTEDVRRRGHAALPTYGLLRSEDRSALTNYIFRAWQSLGLLERTDGEQPVFVLTRAGREALTGQTPVPLRQPPRGRGRRHATVDSGVVGLHQVDPALFEALRGVRKQLAAARGIPPYLVFSDATLREMAAVRPQTLQAMRAIKGVGDRKLAEFGQAFLAACAEAATT